MGARLMPRPRIHATPAARKAANRAARKAAGRRVLWCEISADASMALDRLTSTGATVREVIEQLLMEKLP